MKTTRDRTGLPPVFCAERFGVRDVPAPLLPGPADGENGTAKAARGRPALQRSCGPKTSSALFGGFHAYSLVEVLIGGAILAIAILAASMLAAAILVNQENDGRSLRALNVQEQYAKLYQLGLDHGAITNILPEAVSTANPPGTNGLFFSTNAPADVTVSGAGVMNMATNTMVFHSGSDANGALRYATNTVILARPSIR